MKKSVYKVLGLNVDDKKRVNDTIGHVRSVHEFLTNATEGIDKLQITEAISKALPWAKYIAEPMAEALPTIKFFIKLFELIGKIDDPNKLGYLASTMAYQQSIEQSITAIGEPKKQAKIVAQNVKTELSEIVKGIDVDYDFRKFDITTPFQHEFLKDAQRLFEEFCDTLGYNTGEIRKLTNEVNKRFQTNLKTILSHGKTRDKFEPFSEFLRFDNQEAIAYAALDEHAQYQRWLFEERRVFDREPFALSHVYIDTECGKLAWGEIRDGCDNTTTCNKKDDCEKQNPDAFYEHCGGRHSLGTTVLDLLGDPDFNDAIIVQGVAGSGKSAFTLWLCAELVKQGLSPIRVKFSDVRFDKVLDPSEAFGQAVRISEKMYLPSGLPYSRPDDLFLNGKIFNRSITFGKAEISPYVLILDAWDEISISASEGFKVRLDRMLNQVRGEYLHNRDVPIRVILTGRPSAEVGDINFLRKETPVLTLRPLNPGQLESFTSRISELINNPPELEGESIKWNPFKPTEFNSILKPYKENFKNANSDQEDDSKLNNDKINLEVLGLPLLAHLSLRLLSEKKSDTKELLQNPATLYRNLVDLTTGKAGKPKEATESNEEQMFRFYGGTLRELLRKTAEAMTVCVRENISFEELRLRLKTSKDSLLSQVHKETEENILSKLMVSYYFKGGHTDFGCEFLHKSFREYLFAERVVDILKRYGQELAQPNLPERDKTLYWKDFETSDPRYKLSRELSICLGPIWLTPEIALFLKDLIVWEIKRSFSYKEQQKPIESTPLKSDKWKLIRDSLSDVWDWWAEGVHLRPQPRYNEYENIEYEKAYVEKVIEWSAPRNLEKGGALPPTSRTASIDAHLGDSLFRICNLVHHTIVQAEGLFTNYEDSNINIREKADKSFPRRCQTTITINNKVFVLFNPSGESIEYLRNYFNRINSAGGRPKGPFPFQVELTGADLTKAYLIGADLREADLNEAFLRGAHLRWANLRRANLTGADLTRGDLLEANLAGTLLIKADLARVYLTRANLRGANLTEANLAGAELRRANLKNAILSKADLTRADLREADLRSANLTNTDLTNVYLTEANLAEADLRKADLINSDLRGANLSGAGLRRAKLKGTDLRGAILNGADLRGAILRRANLTGACLTGANLTGADLTGTIREGVDLTGAILDGAKGL